MFTGPTWLQWVLNVEHGGPVAIHHVLLDLIFGNVATAIFYSDTRFQVVEVATVELEELDEQNADVDVGTAHVVPVVKLESTQQKEMSGLIQMVEYQVTDEICRLCSDCRQNIFVSEIRTFICKWSDQICAYTHHQQMCMCCCGNNAGTCRNVCC